jgi:hypothetical protein
MDINKLKSQLAAMQEEINRTAEEYGLGGQLQQMLNGGEIHQLPVMPYGFAENGMKPSQLQRPVYNPNPTRSGDQLQSASNYYSQSGSAPTPTGGMVTFTTEQDLVNQMNAQRTQNPKLQQLSQTTSIVDAMKLMGDDASFANRKKLAQSVGINNYTGTAAQNQELLKMYYYNKATEGQMMEQPTYSLTDEELFTLSGSPAIQGRTNDYQDTQSWQSSPNVNSQFVTEQDLVNDEALRNMVQLLGNPNVPQEFRYGGFAYNDGGEGDEELPNTGAMMMNNRAVASTMPDPNRTRTLDDMPAQQRQSAQLVSPTKTAMPADNMTMFDYFRSHGMDPSFEARKEMFSQVMPGYKGTREQNMELLEKIKSGDLDLSKLKKSVPKATGNKPAPAKKTETPAPKPTPAPAPKNYISPEESLALYRKNQSKMATGAAEALYPERLALLPGIGGAGAVSAAAARNVVVPAAGRLLLPAAQRAAIGTAERLALPTAQRVALPTAERLALNVPRAGAQMEIPFASRVVNSVGQAVRNPGYQARIPFPKGVPGNPGVQTQIQFGVPRVGQQMTIPFRQDGGMNYYAGGEIENDPHIMELYGFQNGGEIIQLPVMPYGFAEMGMMAGDEVTGKTGKTPTPTATPSAPKVLTSQQLAGLTTQFFSRDPSMQTPIPNILGNYQLSNMEKTIMMEAMKQMKAGQGSTGVYPVITPQMIDQIRPRVEQNDYFNERRTQSMGGMNYEDGGQMPMDIAVARFKAAAKDKGLAGGEAMAYVEKMKSKYNYQKGGAVSEKELGNYEVGMYGSGGIMYNGTKFPGYNKAISTAPGDKFKKQMVLQKGGKIKLVKFGHR